MGRKCLFGFIAAALATLPAPSFPDRQTTVQRKDLEPEHVENKRVDAGQSGAGRDDEPKATHAKR